MTIENIENHMAYTCKCGGVNFALLKSGAIECNKCSTPLEDVKWWAGGMGAQLARAIKAEAERDALKAALPVGELPSNTPHITRRIRACESEVPAQVVLEHAMRKYAEEQVAAARSQPVREPLPLMSEAFRTTVAYGPSEDYRMVFKFKDLDSLHAADDEWRKFRGAP